MKLFVLSIFCSVLLAMDLQNLSGDLRYHLGDGAHFSEEIRATSEVEQRITPSNRDRTAHRLRFPGSSLFDRIRHRNPGRDQGRATLQAAPEPPERTPEQEYMFERYQQQGVNLLYIAPEQALSEVEHLRLVQAGPPTGPRSYKETDKIENTRLLGYMLKPSPSIRQDTVPLEQALKTLPLSSNAALQRSHRIGLRTSGNGPHDYHDGSSSTSDQSLDEITEVLLADPDHRKCVVCLEKFKSPQRDGKNRWSFDKVLMIDGCKHYFHRSCLQTWVLGRGHRDCPTCRHEV
ncbi:hypothetical protein PGTUg99_018173 [Puccinia graminis f. sp. tritici]|uniref:RING-type domain-containing protein n=1 Tax=Puccinia graminis f. sp. tritici TaxID=56615 RepID=A0A5B0S7I9_PUCGR|nr:hypothetical protein PGTUg99_018173 [Puccinia graminis f. sp. tritici]